MENCEAEAPKGQKSEAENKPSQSVSAKPAAKSKKPRRHNYVLTGYSDCPSDPEYHPPKKKIAPIIKPAPVVEPVVERQVMPNVRTNVDVTGDSPSGERESALTEVQISARERGQRDLFFFCHEILQYKDMLPRVHQQVCDIYGPPPDPSKPFEFQDSIRNYLILDPRGEFKTSISIGKMLQNWINFPEIAILRMSGVEDLVERAVRETKDHLLTNSILRELYPEHVPWSDKKNEVGTAPTRFGTQGEITSPMRKKPRREPTISISTLQSRKAGSHYEWMIGDDLVNEKNYQTREALQQTIDDWDLARNLMNPRGYRELNGTRYDWSDLYGHIIERNEKKPGLWRIHQRPIWTDDLEFAKHNGFFIPENYQPGDLIQLHPERWTLQELAEIQADNPYLFNCQRLNNPVPASADNFPMKELIRRTVKRDKYPDTGQLNIFMTWQFDFADPEAEPAVGVVGGWDGKGRLFLIDMTMGYFKPSELIDLMVAFWQKWPISRVGFEDSKRQRMLEPGLMSRLRVLKLSFAIDWIKFGGNNQTDDDMINRVLALEPLLRENQLWFHSDLPHLTNLYLQFSRFPKFKLRGIPYAISRLMYYRSQSPMSNASVYGCDLYSPALSWNIEDPELGAGLTG